ncbi:hypothetical protein GKD14_16340 [Paeniclostridium sordellii]|nr:hypothetical protein [Paeniclostridium sordellii]MSB60511.1 hypothetical protein [Paeniclostridium sordellii]
MKTYRELYFKGTQRQLSEFVEQIGAYATGNWSLRERSGRWKEYLFFDYKGDEVDKACVSIYVGNDISKGELYVGNIIPMEKSELSIDEYNAILLKFYNDVIKPYKERGTELNISQPTSDIFNPMSVISENALKKLKLFCNAANKSTGSSHPCDRERWFDFICQTVDDDKIFDYSTLVELLQDESYAWDEKQAYKLAEEYVNACEILQYYKRERGV